MDRRNFLGKSAGVVGLACGGILGGSGTLDVMNGSDSDSESEQYPCPSAEVLRTRRIDYGGDYDPGDVVFVTVRNHVDEDRVVKVRITYEGGVRLERTPTPSKPGEDGGWSTIRTMYLNAGETERAAFFVEPPFETNFAVMASVVDEVCLE